MMNPPKIIAQLSPEVQLGSIERFSVFQLIVMFFQPTTLLYWFTQQVQNQH